MFENYGHALKEYRRIEDDFDKISKLAKKSRKDWGAALAKLNKDIRKFNADSMNLYFKNLALIQKIVDADKDNPGRREEFNEQNKRIRELQRRVLVMLEHIEPTALAA